MLKEFKEFAMRGNVVDMAVGIIIGAAFGAIVKSLVADVIMPPIGLLAGGVDFSDLFIILKKGSVSGPFVTVSEAQKAGAVTINYGLFFNTIFNFCCFSTRKRNEHPKKKRRSPAGRTNDKGMPPMFFSYSNQG